MTTRETVPPEAAEPLAEDHRSLSERASQWVQHDAPSWLISLMLHMTILIVVGLLFGR